MFGAFLAVAAAAASLPKATPVDVASWFHADDYPAEAARDGIEGDVTFEVDVDADGKPTACRVAHSSKSAILDKATCDIVLARGRFKPAMQHGKPVPGRYSRKTSWRLQGTALELANGYSATILDFTKDVGHPTCTVVGSGVPIGPTCAQTLQKYGSEGATAKLTKLIVLMSVASGDEQPYRGEPAWGPPWALTAFDLYSTKTGTKPACAVVTQEGGASEASPCSQFVDASTLSNEDKRTATKVRIELSVFAVAARATSQGKCKDGESTAETRGCA